MLYKKVTFTFTFVVGFLFSTAIAASPPLFGPEFTFTNEEIIEAAYGRDEVITSANSAALEQWFRNVNALCIETGSCTIAESRDKHGKAYRVTYPDGWWYQVSLDTFVLEVQSKPATVTDFYRMKERIQSDIFEVAKSLNMEPHERIGSGHINVGLDGFDGDAKLFRNFLVDTANHPELTWGIFGNHLGNSPPISALPIYSQKAFKKVIRDFDSKPTSITELARRIEYRVYTSNPYNWSSQYYQNLSFRSVYEDTPAPLQRVEIRGYRPQPSAESFLLEISLLEKRLKYLRSKKAPVPLSVPPSHTMSNSEKRGRFLDYLKEMGAREEDYLPIIPKKFLEHPLSSDSSPYDEVFSIDGEVRPHYRRTYEVYESLHPKHIKAFAKQAKVIGSDHRSLMPIPRVLTSEEHDNLMKGVQQRGRALWEFYKDLATRDAKAVRAGIIPENIVDRILLKSAYFETARFQLTNSATYFGPDIVRGPDGKFVVLEDNFGDLGGMADASESRRDLLELLPEYQKVFRADSGQTYAKTIADEMRRMAVPADGEIICLIPKRTLNRNRHFIEQLASQNVRVLFAEDVLKYNLIDTGPDGAFLRTTEGIKKPIGAMILRGIPGEWFRKKIPKVYKAHTDGKVSVLGLDLHDMLGDKEMLQYVDDFVKFYLKEEPILPSLSTKSFRKVGPGNNAIFDKEFLDEVFSDLDQYVIKHTQGVQGNEVWIGKRMDANSKQSLELQRQIALYPGNYVAQKYTPISVLEDHLVDLRVLSIISDQGVATGDRIWGRALHISGDGRLNMSQKGGGVAVFTDGKDSVPEVAVQDNNVSQSMRERAADPPGKWRAFARRAKCLSEVLWRKLLLGI